MGLASIAIVLLLVNVYVGLSGGDYNAPAHEYVAARQEARRLTADEQIAAAEQRADQAREAVLKIQPTMNLHMLLGIGAALMTLLVCSISITYFVGTSRWFKEVVETYRLDRTYVARSAQIKRRSFRWSVFGALAILAVVGLGAAAEPTWANAEHSRDLVQPHYLASLAVIGFLLLSFYRQWSSLAENSRLIEEVMSEVRTIRSQRGLAVEPEPVRS